jgi:protocatechuate 3,4-dioxygenase beta subunit
MSETSLEDYECYRSNVTVTDTGYSMIYFGESITVVVDRQYVKSGDSVTVTVTVLDEYGSPVEDASVELFKEVN